MEPLAAPLRTIASAVLLASAVSAADQAPPRILWDGHAEAKEDFRTYGGHDAAAGSSTATVDPAAGFGGTGPALRWEVHGQGWMMLVVGGFAGGDVPLAGYKALSFHVRLGGEHPPGGFQVRSQAASEDEGAAAHFQDIGPQPAADGAWHLVTVPLAGIYAPKPVGATISNVQIGFFAPQPVAGQVWIDDLVLQPGP